MKVVPPVLMNIWKRNITAWARWVQFLVANTDGYHPVSKVISSLGHVNRPINWAPTRGFVGARLVGRSDRLVAITCGTPILADRPMNWAPTAPSPLVLVAR